MSSRCLQLSYIELKIESTAQIMLRTKTPLKYFDLLKVTPSPSSLHRSLSCRFSVTRTTASKLNNFNSLFAHQRNYYSQPVLMISDRHFSASVLVIVQRMANLYKKHMTNLHIRYWRFLSTECSIKCISQYFSLIRMAATIINIRLHKASIFFPQSWWWKYWKLEKCPL